LDGKRDDIGSQSRFITWCGWNLALHGTMQAENPARTVLAETKLRQQHFTHKHGGARARKFSRTASTRTSLSSVRSEMARRRREFFILSSFNRLTWPPFNHRIQRTNGGTQLPSHQMIESRPQPIFLMSSEHQPAASS
jgi:hypothetical protein